MADRDAILLRPAREFYDSCPPDVQRELSLVIDDLCDNPAPDYVLRFILDAPPEFPLFYRDEQFVVVYEEVNAWTIEIWTIAVAEDDLLLTTKRPE